MWVIFLEAGVALFLLLLIVWATWPSRAHPPADQDEPPSPPANHD